MRLADLLGPDIDTSPWQDIDISRVTLDSRRVSPGTLFVAAAGVTPDSRDGRSYINEAIVRGASAIVMQDPDAALKKLPIPVFHSSDPRRTCAQLVERLLGYPSHQVDVAGITGTNGKTTTSFLLASIASAHANGVVIGTIGNGFLGKLKQTTHTTPEAEDLSALIELFRSQEAKTICMEVSSIALTTRRVDGIRFAVAALTNLASDHLDFHHTLQVYHQEKFRLFSELLPSGAPAVLPAKHPWIPLLEHKNPIISWGHESDADVHVREWKTTAQGLTVELNVKGSVLAIQSHLFGAVNLDNIMVAAACAHGLGMSNDAIVSGISQLVGVPGRFEKVPNADQALAPMVFIDYAHTSHALESTLRFAREIAKNRVIVVFGCGGNRDAQKRPIMGQVAAQLADTVILTDDNPRHENSQQILADIESGMRELKKRPFSVLEDRKMAIHEAIKLATPDDVVVIAGKGHENTQQYGDKFLPFNDKEIATQALQERGL